MTDMQPAEAFAQLGRIRFAETDLDGILAQVAGLAKRSIPGAEEVSVTLLRGRGAHTAAFTGQLAVALDEWQYAHRAGPCLAAAESTATLSVPDMSTEHRWLAFARRAREAGCRSSLSVGLPMQDPVAGALNIYAAEPGAFDDGAVTVAQTFSGYAAVALANAHLYDAEVTLAQHLQAAMASRAVIEQAKGVIMGRRRCTADEAFQILSQVSQDTQRKVRDIAAALVHRTAATDEFGL
jgi:GAF domain-containing protein